MGNLKSQNYEIIISDHKLIPDEVLFWFDSYIENDHDYHRGEDSLFEFMKTLKKQKDFKLEGNCESDYPDYLNKFIINKTPIPGISKLYIRLDYWDENWTYLFTYSEDEGWRSDSYKSDETK